MAKLTEFVREETLRTIENKAVDMQVSAVEYVNKFFSKINPMDIQDKLDECFTQKQIDEVVASVPNWAEDIRPRIKRKLLDPNNKYSEDELKEEYPKWMVVYAVTAFDSEHSREAKIFKEIKRAARESAKNIEALKKVNQIVLGSALTKLPTYA